MADQSSSIISKVWGMCGSLRDDRFKFHQRMFFKRKNSCSNSKTQ